LGGDIVVATTAVKSWACGHRGHGNAESGDYKSSGQYRGGELASVIHSYDPIAAAL
jgi:hypothetical protein